MIAFKVSCTRILARMLPLLILMPVLSLGQETRGTISGTVSDSSGAVVPNATECDSHRTRIQNGPTGNS
jgi:hypothetical protein